jgi:hypothetical protein
MDVDLIHGKDHMNAQGRAARSMKDQRDSAAQSVWIFVVVVLSRDLIFGRFLRVWRGVV